MELFDRRVRLGAKGALSTLWAFVYRPPYRPRGEIRRILIIVYPPGLGDYVVATSFLTAVGAAFDGASLEVLAGGPHAEVLGSHPSISDAILYEDSWISKDDKGASPRPWWERKILWDHLREKRYDLVFDLLGNFASAQLTYQTGAPLRVGFSSGVDAFLTHPVPDLRFTSPSKPMTEHQGDLLRRLGIEPIPSGPSVHPSPKDEAFAESLISETGLGGDSVLLGLAPAADHPSRRWEEEAFAALGDRLAQGWGGRCLLFGGEKDRDYLGSISRRMASRPANFTGRANALQTASLLRRCRMLVSVNTGLMHLGAAVGLPVVALYGDGPPLWHPWGEGHQILTRPLRRRGAGEGEPLSVEEVLQAARRILGPPLREVSSDLAKYPAAKESSRTDGVREEGR